MPQFNLSILAIVLGLVFGLPHIYGMMNPAGFAAALRKFPRNTPVGYVFMIAATGWFLANLTQETVSDFTSFKPALYGLFALVGIGACLFVKDFLPIRGLAVFLLMLAKSMVDSARWVDTGWSLVITSWAYLWVVAGIWFTVTPWRLRDLIEWATADHNRLRVLCACRLAFGLFVVVLGATVFRGH